MPDQNQIPDSLKSFLGGGGGSTTPQGSQPLLNIGGSAPSVPDSLKSFLGSGAESPDNEQNAVGPSTPPQHLYQDPSQSWYSRAWDWSNTPLTESLFGMPEERQGAGGFERGVEHIAAGLTSPLSLALGAATFGSGGFIAGAGETALKESGEFTAAQIADAISASKIALKTAKGMPDIEPVISGALKVGGHDLDLLERARALTFPINRDAELASEELQKNLSGVGLSEAQRTALKEGTLSEAERSAIATANTKIPGFSTEELKALSDTGDTVAKAKSGFNPLDDAVRSAGHDVDNWKKATAILSDKKLDVTKDLLGGNLLQRGAFQILHKAAPDVSFGALTKAADTANTVMNWGFTYQQLETAAQMSPRFFDALKEGDADHAWEYGTEMFASGAMGALGAPHALRSAGELFNPLLGSTDVPRLSDRWLAIERVNKDREVAHAVAEQDAVNKYNTAFDLLGLRKAHPVLGLSKEDKAFNTERLAECQTRIATETDPEKARVLHNVLVEAQGGGEYQPIPAPLGTPLADNEAPPRAGTKSVATTSSGEVRVGSDGRPVVWLSPEDYGDFQTIAQTPGSGVNYSPREADIVLSRFNPESSIGQLISKARQLAGPTSVLKTPGENPEFSILVAQEEAQHAEQRWLSQNGEVYNLLDGATRLPSGEIKVEPGSPWDRLHGIIPTVTHSYFDSLDYDQNPVVRVAETAAKYQAGVDTGASKTERINFLDEYFKELEAKHGPQAREKFARINEIARQHVEDIYAERQAAEARASRLAEQGTGVGSVRRLEEGREGGAGQGPARGSEEGLASRIRDLDEGKLVEYSRAKEIFRAALPPEIAKEAIGKLYGKTGGTKWISPKEIDKIGREALSKFPKGLTSRVRELDEEPLSFASPNVHNLGGIDDAQTRLESRPQKIAEKLSGDLASALKIKASVRPALGHWERGAENSVLGRFAPGTDPDAVEYHNTLVAKAGYQNAGAGFIPGEGKDVLFQFRVADAAASAKQIAEVLEQHGIPGDTIEPTPGGNTVHIVSPNGELRPQVSEIAARLGTEKVGEIYGRKFENGDYANRDAAQSAFDRRIAELEAKHPEWSGVRQAFESRPDHVELRRLVRETQSPFVDVTHGSRTPGLDVLKPEMFGKGPQKGAEQSRARAYPKDFPERTYFQTEGTHGEPFYTHMPYQYKTRFNAENLYDLAKDPEGLLGKAREEAVARKMPGPDAIWTIYERMIKDAGHDGGFKPDGTVMAFKDTPVEAKLKADASGRPLSGLASREKPAEWDDIKSHLTPEEVQKHDTPEKQNLLTAAFNSMPDHEEWSAAIRAGKAGQLWYERSTRAFDALIDSGIPWLWKADKEKFLNFTAALSPVQPVQANLRMALNLWAKWDKAGRPQDVTWKDGKVASKNASLYRVLAGRGETQGVDLPARMGNAIRALQGEPLSGPKVSAFTKNLGKDSSRVTNDTWMAVFGDHDPNRINKPAVYDAMSAKVREAAKAEGVEPRQAQAAIWCFIKSLAELSGWGNDRWIPPQEIIKQGLLTPELVAQHSADFADMLKTDPEIRGVIKKLGGDLDALDTKLETYVPRKPITGEAQEPATHLLNAAGRLEAARRDSRIASHLARKSGPSLFDTEFGPDNGLFSKEKENRAPQWYLKSNQLVDGRMQGPMPADTVLKMLENNGVKPDELKYTGLSDFLREKGSAPVRPEEVKDYLAANNLQVQEVTKHRWEDGEKFDPAKFGKYTLPGAEPGSYREMLMTLPKEAPKPGPMSYEQWAKGLNYGQDDIDARRMYSIWERIRPVQGEKDYNEDFRSAHWDEPNVVGHVRFNDRTGPNGEKLLHLEELQSDWHQKGRTQGYKSELTPEEEQRRYQVARERNAAAEERAYHRQDQDSTAFNEATSRMETLDKELEGLNKKKNGGVPDAPFKKTWTELLMKRMIRYASEHGYDGISWTPGEEQIKRYPGLSEVADTARYDPEREELTALKNGKPVKTLTVSPRELPGMIGKEPAQNLLNSERRTIPGYGSVHEISGSDLNIDAEGMRKYYDDVPDKSSQNLWTVNNKLGKQFGAKVGETKIGNTSGEDVGSLKAELVRLEKAHSNATQKYHEATSPVDKRFLSGAATSVYEDLVRAREAYKTAERNQSHTVPYFPITDSMRESVLSQGQPLFSRESPDNGHLPPNIDDMIQNNVFKDKPKEYRDLVMSTYRKAATTAPDPQMKAATDFIRQEHDRSFEIGSANDILQHHIDDYFQRTWDNSNPEGRSISADAKNGKFATNVTMARRRVYDSTLTGLLKSPKQLKFDIVNNMARGRAEIIKAAANRQFIRSLRDDFSRGSDGRPAVVLAGSGGVVTGQDGEDPKTFISPDRVQKINIAQSNIDEMKKSGDFDRFLADGTIKDITPHVHPDNIGMAIDRLEKQALSKNAQYDEVGNNKLRTDLMYLKSMLANKDYSGLREFNDAQKSVYTWDPQDYVTLDHNAMRGWNFVTNDSAGHGILVDADIKAHPEFAQYLKNRLGLEESGIAKNPVGKALLGAGSAAKHVLLSLSPFHMVQIGLRGVMTGINPFTLHGPDLLDGAKIDPSNPHSETKLLAMVRQGYTTGTDFRGQQQMSEGLSTGGDALRRIPGIGNTIANSMNWYQDFLFKRYIPAMKATAGEHLFDQYRASHPEWSNDRVAKAAALHANESFGGINWRAMGRSTTTQDWGRLMLLAPDWLESEMRSGARLFNREEGNIGRKQVVMMTLGMWGIARVLNTLSTGSPHLEAPFGLAVKNKEGKEIIFGMRTLPTDLLHAATDPVGFIKGRLSPTILAGQELRTQRDSFGRKLGPEDLWADVFHNMMPIPGQAIGQAVTGTGPQVGTVGQVWKAGGGTAQVYATPAQKMAAELAANHNEDGPIDRAQMDRHRRIMDLEDQVRSGETSWPELVKLAYNTDQLKESELKKIQLNLTKTKGMDSTMASLYTRASRLPAAEFFKLFDTMNNSEKTALIPLTQSVMKRYTAKAMKDMTPSERAKDPTLQRILNMMHPSGGPPPTQEQ